MHLYSDEDQNQNFPLAICHHVYLRVISNKALAEREVFSLFNMDTCQLTNTTDAHQRCCDTFERKPAFTSMAARNFNVLGDSARYYNERSELSVS